MFNLAFLYSELCDLGISTPRRVAEVGVNEPDKCSLLGFVQRGIPAILVEPLPWCAEHLCAAFKDHPVQVIEGVVGDKDGSVLLYDRGEGSWIEDVPAGGAPDEHHRHSSMTRDTFDPRFTRSVRSYRWANIDPGDIDILCVDTEGAEWFVVREMVSRPALVRLEMHFTHSGWVNPHADKIRQRMTEMGYVVIGEDVSDVLWAKRLCAKRIDR